MGLTIDPSRHQCPGQYPVTTRRIQRHCLISRGLACRITCRIRFHRGNFRGPSVGERTDFVEAILKLLSLFLELPRLTTLRPGLPLLPWRIYLAICLHLLGRDFFGASSPRTRNHRTQSSLLMLPLAHLSYCVLVLAARRRNVPMLISSRFIVRVR